MTKAHKTNLAAALDRIVEAHRMPEKDAIALLSSAVIFLTIHCDAEKFVDAVAHTRLCIPDDFADAHGALCGWLDRANELLEVKESVAQ